MTALKSACVTGHLRYDRSAG